MVQGAAVAQAPGRSCWPIAYIVLTGIYTAVGFAIVEWWEPSAAGEREADFNRWLEDHRTESRNTLAEWGSALSNTETKIGLLLMLLPLMLWMYRRWHDWAFLVVALLFEVSVFGTSSKIVVRERPPVEQLDGAPTNSWPSGHIAAAFVFYIGLALVVYWNTRSKLSRTVFTVIAVPAPVIVTVSRLYQGMHYLSDVAGGIVLAAITLMLVRALMMHAGEDPQITRRHSTGGADGMTTCTDLLLGPLLRHVARTSATIWVETSAPCAVEVLGRPAPTFTVEGHHYALVIVEGLVARLGDEYEVHLDGDVVWPLPDDPFPPAGDAHARRRAAPDPVRHLPGGGAARAAVDARARSRRARPRRRRAARPRAADAAVGRRASGPTCWCCSATRCTPTTPSPRHRAAHRARCAASDAVGRAAPEDVVADFEQYTWLYHEAWTPDVERWVLSVVPSTMVFDDHDMIDDWNISESWVADIRRKPWWKEHIIGGLMSYWVYQHLGNLAPDGSRRKACSTRARRSRRRHAAPAHVGGGVRGVTRRCPAAITSTSTATSATCD